MKKRPIDILKVAVRFPSYVRDLRNRINHLEDRVRQMERMQRYYYHATLSEAYYPEELSKIYFDRTGQRLNLSDPRTYNEKIQWFKLYGITPEITMLADKYKVREYVAERIGEEYLVPLLGHWRYPEDIDFAALPDKFVLKANHGCGYNYIVQDKANMDISDCIAQANRWLKEDYCYWGFEMQYHGIEKMLIAEQYLENAEGDLYDYKVWCFNGRAEYIMFLTNRKQGLTMDFYDRDWNFVPITYNHPNSGIRIPRPDNIDELIDRAEKLAEGLAHVRVDFYRTNEGRLYFGEMTFTSCSGTCKWNPPETDFTLGELFDYPGMNNK